MSDSDTPRMGSEASMPPRSKAPGLKIGRTLKDGTRLPYWCASNLTRDTMGFRDPCIELPRGDSAETMEALRERLAPVCHEHTARLRAWIDEQKSAAPPSRSLVYDGTLGSLCRIFVDHPESSFHDVRPNTQRTYLSMLRMIGADMGAERVRSLTALDFKRQHRLWKEPAEEGGRERIDRAHKAMTLIKMALSFGGVLEFKKCADLAEALGTMRFPRGGAREQQLTHDMVVAFVRKALEMDDPRAAIGPLAMAIGVAAQFDLMLRQKDVIGEWCEIDGKETWSGPFRWRKADGRDALPGWKLRLKTSKTRTTKEFDLRYYTLLFPLLESVPNAERVGAIVTDRKGEPVRERTYRQRFRAIAQAAGVPDDVWLMDARAGGATEAEDAGADLKAISDHLTHSDISTTLRYLRSPDGRTKEVADARAKKRASDRNADD